MAVKKKTTIADEIPATDENVKRFDPNKRYKILQLKAGGNAGNPVKSFNPKFRPVTFTGAQLASTGVGTADEFWDKNPLNLDVGKEFHIYEVDGGSAELIYFDNMQFTKSSGVLNDELVPQEQPKEKIPADTKAMFELLLKERDERIKALEKQNTDFQNSLNSIHADYKKDLDAKDEIIAGLQKTISDAEFEKKVDAKVIAILKENPQQANGLADKVSGLLDKIPDDVKGQIVAKATDLGLNILGNVAARWIPGGPQQNNESSTEIAGIPGV